MVKTTDMHNDPSIAASAQKMLMEAGYHPKGEWIYIEDLVQNFRRKHVDREDLLMELKIFLDNVALPVSRSSFAEFQAKLQQRDKVKWTIRQQEARLAEIYTKAGIKQPGIENEKLAQRIIDLEDAVQLYARQLKSVEIDAAKHKSKSAFPFFAGIIIGGILF